VTREELLKIEDNIIRHAGDVATIRREYLPALIAEVKRLQENTLRLEHYRQFVAQISEALGVPDDSMILPHAQAMAAKAAKLDAVPVGEIDDSISAWQRGEFDDHAMRVLLRWREETTKSDDVSASPSDKLPTSGFFTRRWDFSEA